MIQFVWPWVFAVLPLPYLFYRFAPPLHHTEQQALFVPFANEFHQSAHASASDWVKPSKLVWAVVAWSLLILAAAQPQWLDEPVGLPVSGRDLMLAVDLSGSMERADFVIGDRRVDRLTATKRVASQFIRRREGDRIGLILFGKQAYIQAPLTFDRETVRTLLNEAVIGLAGKETAIGDAIGLAVKRSRIRNEQLAEQKDTRQRSVLILLTDGANTAGEVSPRRAAALAAAENLIIYTIGIGADEMQVRSIFGSRTVNPSADLDEAALKAIASTTGGRYFRARDTRELEKIYDLLDELEPIEEESQKFRPTISLYYWPLALATIIAAILLWNKIRPRKLR